VENYIQILRHPLISNMRNPLRRELPQDATLEQAIAAAKSYGDEMQQSFSYFYLKGLKYSVLEGGIFEMDAANKPVRKVADYNRTGITLKKDSL
jgi:hypothetical protein